MDTARDPLLCAGVQRVDRRATREAPRERSARPERASTVHLVYMALDRSAWSSGDRLLRNA
jgi:hypothetical protein